MNPLLLSGLFEIGKGIINRIFPDPAQAAAAQLELLKMQQNGDLAQLAADTDLAKLQIQVNIEEAKHANIFVGLATSGRMVLRCRICLLVCAVTVPAIRGVYVWNG
jgi:hypothetical protein